MLKNKRRTLGLVIAGLPLSCALAGFSYFIGVKLVSECSWHPLIAYPFFVILFSLVMGFIWLISWCFTDEDK